MSVPKLRFKEFSGEWLENNLGDFVGFTSGHPFDGSKFGMDGKKLVIPKNFTKFGHGNFSTEYSKFTTEEANPKYICRSGDLLLLMTDLSRECELLGKPLYLKNDDKEVLLNQRIARVEPSEAIHLPFLLNLLLTDKYHKKIKELATGSTVKHLSISSIREIRLNYPGYDEQDKVATFLSKVDQKISLLTKKHELLIHYKKGVMKKIFNQEIRFKDGGGRDYPEWNLRKIGDALTIGSGRDYKHLDPGDIPVYGTGGFMLSVNDFLYDGVSACIGRKGTIDKPVLLSGKFWAVDTLFYTHKFINCTPEFIYACFQTINWKSYCEASGVPSLSKSTIEAIEINLPCIAEQKQITDFFAALDNKITNIKSKLALSREYKQGLLQQMFI
ncbi:restriction endonuclease subunit S [Polynucleobacter sp. Latsch14-2]|jgi:type I restriction enzyme S subunit|uniref:restriction endonuclease subunit S n=1 Tax=Polynucleobacter sp. Latsch14-2 TaxID=2576920 RepID=UPI001C0CF78E|nr:restriction endonuclease subunit S [Polynucleobacter sp. Latsch14-2]MBU3615518.1 restriction endonuclease subunit S [Polynucleobacter sp. Latsch14-2]